MTTTQTTKTYSYFFYDEESKKDIRITLISGVDGVTDEDIDALIEMDEDVRIQNERHERNLDARYVKAKCNFEDPKHELDLDPEQQLPDTYSEECYEPTEDEELLRMALETLKDSQQELMWATFGDLKFDAEIGRERGVSRQAIYSQKRTIFRKLELEINKLK